MKILMMCVVCYAVAAAQSSIEGRVLNDATGDALKNATLTLQRVGRAPVTAETGDDGVYSFPGLEPGTYSLRAERYGFLPMAYGARRPGQTGGVLRVEAAEQLKNVEIKLVPQGAIAGRVLDADGDPFSLARIDAMRLTYVNGSRQLVAAAIGNRQAMTNDLGEYRIFGLAPGRYYLRAVPMGSHTATPDLGGTSPPTYYAETQDARNALPLDIVPGRVIQGVDIKLVSAPGVSLSGRVTDRTGGKIQPQVILFPEETGLANAMALVNEQGNFVFNGVPPGRYWMIARSETPSGGRAAAARIDVEGRAVENVAIEIDAGVAISGSVAVGPGSDPIGNVRTMRVSLEPDELNPVTRLLPPTSAGVGADGTFALAGAPRGRYRLAVAGVPDGYYIQSARSGDVDLLEGGVDLSTAGAASIEIVLSSRGGSIEGETSLPGATIVLVPERRSRLGSYVVARTDQRGHFALPALPPGSYKLFAWQDIEDGAWMDPEVLQPVEERGIPLMVEAGGGLSVTVVPISTQ